MSLSARYQLWIVAVSAVIFLTNLGQTALWDMDEALYATCAREMLQRGDWVVPWFNGRIFYEKPPLMFWEMMAGYELFGVTEFGARFFSAVFGIMTALVAFHLGRILCNARVGLWTGLITATTIIFTISARAATVDSALTLATTLAMWLFVMGIERAATAATPDIIEHLSIHHSSFITHHSPNPGCIRPFKLQCALPMYACIGLAVLGKGPVGAVLPLAAMGLFLLSTDGWRNIGRTIWRMRPITAAIVITAVVLPWCYFVSQRTEGEWLRQFLIEFNLRPFKQPILGHGDAGALERTLALLVSISYYFYHIPAVLFGFFPWSVLLGPTLIDCIARLRQNNAWRDGCLLAACWFGVWFLFWSVCKTKLPHYLLPAYPALALMTAMFIDRWLGATENQMNTMRGNGTDNSDRSSSLGALPAWYLRNAWISLILAGVGILIAVPVVAAIYLPGEQWLALVGLLPIIGGAWCWRQTTQQQHQQAAVGLAALAVVFLTALFGFAALRVDRHQNARPMIAAIRTDWTISADNDPAPFSTCPIATYRFFRESTVFYAGHPVTVCDDDFSTGRMAPEVLRNFLKKSQPAYVITTNAYATEIEHEFPNQFQEIFRQRRFLGPGEMVVLRTGQWGR